MGAVAFGLIVSEAADVAAGRAGLLVVAEDVVALPGVGIIGYTRWTVETESAREDCNPSRQNANKSGD